MAPTEHPSNEKLAKKLARAIFNCGDELGDQVRRIAFKTGNWSHGTERELGGLNEAALTRVILEALEKP